MDSIYWREKLQAYRAGTLPEEELRPLWEALAAGANAEEWQALIRELGNEARPDPGYRFEDWEAILQSIFNHDRMIRQQAKIYRMHLFRRWAVAVVLALSVGFGIYKIRLHSSRNAGPAIVTQDVPAPSHNRATITLASGRQIALDSAAIGQLAQQGATSVEKTSDGQIRYTGPVQGKLIYNTIINPRGSGVVSLTLSDGTRIWLNAASSIRYPAVFAGDERRVEISGEAYFAVAHNDRHPFRVLAAGQLIEDLGTEFDVNAYTDEPAMKTTLVKGSIKVGTLSLHPGEQASVDPGGHIELEKGADLEEVLAWKNGQFRFHSTDPAVVLRQASRWYGVDIDYRGHIDGTISGGISRAVNISQLLHILELTRKMTFSIEGKTIVVQAVTDR